MSIVLGGSFLDRLWRTLSPHWCSARSRERESDTPEILNHYISVRSTVDAYDEVPPTRIRSGVALKASTSRGLERWLSRWHTCMLKMMESIEAFCIHGER